jgi:hypothetical protein
VSDTESQVSVMSAISGVRHLLGRLRQRSAVHPERAADADPRVALRLRRSARPRRLTGGNEYDAEIVNDEGLVEHTRVNGIVVAALSRKDGASLSLVIELDERGEVIQDWFGQEPAKEMNGWPNVNWQPFPLGRSPDDFVRLVFGDE